MIEIQKAKDYVDLMRFRNYRAEQYKREDEIADETGKTRMPLPLITIYMLGFTLPDIESPAIKVDRQYIDLINNVVINQKCYYIENLTHDCYVVQIPRIQPRLQTRLEALLTIFEQANFVDERGVIKDYNYPISDEHLKEIISILQHAGSDPAERAKIEREQEAIRTYDAMFGEMKRNIEAKEKTIEEKDKLIEELKRQLAVRGQKRQSE